MFTKAICTALLLILFLSLFFPFRVMASITTLSVQPKITKIWGIDETLNINITITDVNNLYGWEARIYYDPKILNGTNIVEGPFLKSGGSTYNITSFDDNYNSTHGRAMVAFTLIGNVSGVSGIGVLATITFKTKGLGVSLLDFAETRLGDPNSIQIFHNVADGAVQVVKAIRDVAIKDVTTPSNQIVEGQTVNIMVVLANEGNKTETFEVTAYRNETVIGSQTVSNLTKQTETTLTFNWDTTDLPLYASYVIKGEAFAVPDETDLDDNVFVNGVVAIVEGIHNIAINGVTPSATIVYEGQLVDINVVVANVGNYTETFSVTVYYDGMVIETRTVSNLLYGSEENLGFVWDTIGVMTDKSYTIRAVASTVPEETNMTDNSFTGESVTVYPRELLSIEITEVLACDQSGQPVTGFTLGGVAYFKVKVNSNSVKAETLLATINLYDAYGVTIGVVSFQGPIGPGTNTFMLGLPIPTTAHLGTATVHANVFSDWPHLGGTPYSPEKSATFEIVG